MAAGHVDENAQIAFPILMRIPFSIPIPAHIPISIRSLIWLLNTFFHIYTFALFIYFVVGFAALEQFTGVEEADITPGYNRQITRWFIARGLLFYYILTCCYC